MVFFPLTLLVPFLYLQSGCVGFGRRDAGREREQCRRPPGQAEEEVSQPVHPPDQQHRAGALGPAERHAGGTGDHLHTKIKARGTWTSSCCSASVKLRSRMPSCFKPKPIRFWCIHLEEHTMVYVPAQLKRFHNYTWHLVRPERTCGPQRWTITIASSDGYETRQKPSELQLFLSFVVGSPIKLSDKHQQDVSLNYSSHRCEWRD